MGQQQAGVGEPGWNQGDRSRPELPGEIFGGGGRRGGLRKAGVGQGDPGGGTRGYWGAKNRLSVLGCVQSHGWMFRDGGDRSRPGLLGGLWGGEGCRGADQACGGADLLVEQTVQQEDAKSLQRVEDGEGVGQHQSVWPKLEKPQHPARAQHTQLRQPRHC